MKYTVPIGLALASAAFVYLFLADDHEHMYDNTYYRSEAIDKKQAIAAASNALYQLVSIGYVIEGSPLEVSWIKAITSGKIHQKGNDHYIVSFDNDSGKTLYLLLSGSGQLHNANFSGKFKGINF